MLYKKIIFAALLAFYTTAAAQSEGIGALLTKFGTEKDVTSINISRPMFGMLGKLSLRNADMKDLKPFLDKIKSLKILVVEPTATKVKDALLSSVKSLNYQELMAVNSEGDQVRFLSKNAEKGLLHDVLLHINSEGDNVFMLLEGDMTMDDISKFSSEMQQPAKNNTAAATSERVVAAFHAIEASSGANIVLAQGPLQRLSVDADQNKQRFVKTAVENGVLKVSVEYPGKNKNTDDKIKIYVTVPDLDAITLDSGSLLSADTLVKVENLKVKLDSGSLLKGKFEVKRFAVGLDSGSSMKIDAKAENFSLNADSGSAATVSGDGQNLSINLDSGSSCNMLDFDAQNVVVRLDSGSSARVSVSQNLNASVDSGATLHYRGNPANVVAKKKLFSGNIVHLDH